MRSLLWISVFLCLSQMSHAQSYPSIGDGHWKTPVANAGALPLTGNNTGDLRIETTTFSIYTWNGAAWLLQSTAGAAPGTVTNVTGTAPVVITGVSTVTPNVTMAASTNAVDGYLTAADHTTFAAKVATTRTLNTTAPITGGGDLSVDRTFAIAASTNAVDGYLTAADHTTFAAKVAATRTINTTAPLTGGGDFSADRTFAMPASTNAVDGYLTAADHTTFAAAAGGGISSLTGEATGTGPGATAVTLTNSAVIGKVLTGFVSGAGAVTATDTILQAFDKVVGNIATKETQINLTQGSVPFAAVGGDLTQDNADFFWDNTNKRFLVGTNPTASPGDNGQINSENSGGTDSNLNLINRGSNNSLNIQTEGANVVDATLSANASAGGASVTLARSRGTINAKTQMLAGDVFGGLFFQGYTGATFTGYGAAIAAVATQNITAANSGAELVFTTSPNGTNAGNIPRLIIDQDGTTEPGLDATYTLGKAGARWKNTRLSDLSISTVPYTNASGDFQSSAVTPTELGYSSGVTSAIQTQLNAKLALAGGTMTGVLDMGANNITSSHVPASGTDLTNKTYVDQVAANGVAKGASVYATTAALPANVYNNGASGVGATLTGVAFGALVVDGNTVVVGQRILVKNEVTQANNGIYTVTTVGAVATLYVLTRATDFNQTSDIVDGATTFITSGATLSNQTWQLDVAGAVTVGTTSLVFNQIAGPGTIPTQTAPANQFFNSFTTPSTFGSAQPAFSNLSGSATQAQLPNMVVLAKVANYTILTTDTFLTGSGTFNFTLPVATSTLKQPYTITNIGAGVLTILPNGVDTIISIASITVNPGQSVDLYPDGVSNWNVR